MAKPTADDWLRGLRGGRVSWGGPWLELVPGVRVPRTPARLDGVFWGVSAATCQTVADAMGCQLITPLVADLIRDRAEVRLDFEADESSGSPEMLTERAMLRYSASLVHELGRRELDMMTRDAELPLCCLGAKDWVLTRGLQDGRNPYSGKTLPPSWACNYGAYHPSGSLSVSGRWHVIQSPGYAHDAAHEDYSQLLRLCKVAPGVTAPAHDGCTLRRLPGFTSKAGLTAAPEEGLLPVLVLLGLGFGL